MSGAAVRAGRHDTAARRWEKESVGEYCHMLISAIAITILETPDPPRGRCDRIIDHLGDIEASVFIPGDRHRARHVGLGGHQLDGQRRVGQFERRQLIAR